jgi:hypothetical protein
MKVPRAEVVKLRETGLSYAEIGRKLGISRQRPSEPPASFLAEALYDLIG